MADPDSSVILEAPTHAEDDHFIGKMPPAKQRLRTPHHKPFTLAETIALICNASAIYGMDSRIAIGVNILWKPTRSEKQCGRCSGSLVNIRTWLLLVTQRPSGCALGSTNTDKSC
jgi:hypothetical protein